MTHPTKFNYLFEYDRKSAFKLLQSKVKKAPQLIVEEYTYRAPRKLSNIEKYNWSKWMDKEFPKVKSTI